MRAYAPHEGYVEPARGSAALVQTVVGFIAVEFLYGLGRNTMDWLLFQIAPDTADALMERVSATAILYDLAGFLLLALLVVFVAWKNHNRGLRSLTGPAALVWPDMLRATIGGGLLYLALEAVYPFWTDDGVSMQPFATWLGLLPFALLALLIQTGAEELFYRGYLQQQIAARFPSPLVWMVVPNLAFASVHWFNEAAVDESTRYVIWAFAFGLAASDLVARSGSLGAAIGFHLANNIFAFLVVGDLDGPDSGLALFLYPPLPDGTGESLLPPEPILGWMLVIDLVIVALAWLAVRVAIRR